MLTDITPREALKTFSKALVAVLEDNDRLARELATATTANKKKLTPREVQEIRRLKSRGMTQRELAEAFDVNPATVSRIVRGHYHRGV